MPNSNNQAALINIFDVAIGRWWRGIFGVASRLIFDFGIDDGLLRC